MLRGERQHLWSKDLEHYLPINTESADIMDINELETGNGSR